MDVTAYGSYHDDNCEANETMQCLRRFRQFCALVVDGDRNRAERTLTHCIAQSPYPESREHREHLLGCFLCIAVECKHVALTKLLLNQIKDRSPRSPVRQAMRLMVINFERNKDACSLTDAYHKIALLLYEHGAANFGVLGPELPWKSLLTVQTSLFEVKSVKLAEEKPASLAATVIYSVLRIKQLQRQIASHIARLVWETKRDSSVWFSGDTVTKK